MKSEKIKEANNFISENIGKLNNEYRLKYHLMGEYGWINDSYLTFITISKLFLKFIWKLLHNTFSHHISHF